MTHKVDDTLRDDGRREIAQITGREVNKVVPEHFKTDYPKLVSFLEQYYHFEDSDGSPRPFSFFLASLVSYCHGRTAPDICEITDL